MSYKGNNMDKIYKATNNVLLNSGLKHSKKKLRGCLSKVGYDTEFEAEVTSARRHMNYYKCNYCPHYHLTSKPQ